MAGFSMAEPMCLIENGKDGKLCVQPKAFKILEQIRQRVVVVAVVGYYRTGKSYLMNQLAGKRNGFALGATIQSKTKGIWMWCVPHPVKKDHTLVLLDTEGLGDVEKGDQKNDTWIFSLAVLLSSMLVYNSMGTINNEALQQLHYVTELTERIKVKSQQDEDEDESTEFLRVFPSFVWSVRDFTLTLELDGKPVTADEYLQNALMLKPGHSKAIQMYNMPRSCLRNYFPTRKCFVFDRPATTEKMRILDTLADADLDPSFVKQVREFCCHVFSTAESKTLKGGVHVTGTSLGNLAKIYVDAICSNQIPCLENAVLSLAQIQNAKAVAQAKDHYKAQMAERVAYPTESQEELSQIHRVVEKEALKILIDCSFKDDDQKYQQMLLQNLDKMYAEILIKNIEESKKVCESIIKHVFQPLEDQLSSGRYVSRGGYKTFCADIQRFINQYRSTSGKGVQAEEALKKYLDGKKAFQDSILTADQSLTEAERQIQAEQAKAQALEQQHRAEKEMNDIYEKLLKDQEQSHKELTQQLMEKMEEDRLNAAKEYDRMLAAKLKEQEDLLSQNFNERAELLQQNIDALKQEKRAMESNKPSFLGNILGTVGSVAMFLPGGVSKVVGVTSSLLSRFF
ncbi:guanylate-binding protein 1 isoform X2 [Brienomyrus brachyistius]|uniref:guanylate-binding protein 1 isoform X2 n=1 Tax=Brienomyrus brachyistius TaxID=42636 RepID=UPI0020B4101D|nr:guanylate-binding protein 1 isoform X2 [Brienomyrus brachyistius]XP_048882157.1 guanylate-binding protein 1 isoform X2 [Brienomyrus brachyistius]